MKRRFLALALLLFSAGCFAQEPASSRYVCDNTCETESQAEVGGNAGYSVVSPVGRGTVEMIAQAPRLSTLAGKTIAVVGVSFMSAVTHPEIKRLIQEAYPDARVILLDEIGTAGVYPAPGIRRRSVEEFQARLKELHVDAVISGNGGCGLCTPKETGSCIAAEYLGIPSVIIAGPGFSDQARYTALNNGVPVLRVAEYPGAFALHTRQQLLENTRTQLWPRIVEALTRPIDENERQAGLAAGHGDIRDDVFFGTLEEIDRYFKEMGWSDGLPFIPPTFERVEAFLRYTDYAWDRTVAVLPIAHRNTTAWHVAVNGVMAGCRPEHMPVLIALTQTLGAPEFRRTLASTHAWIPFCWLNGPVGRQLGFDCGQGEIDSEANMALGRFMNLALMNLCGYYVKQDRMGTFGYPMSWCLAEDDAACQRVGWKPYHVRAGFDLDESTVTAASTLLWGNNMAPSTTDPQKLMELMAWDITERCQFALGSGRPMTNRTILMTEAVAQILSGKYRSPEALEKDLVATARRPVKERAFANYYANPGSAKDGGEHSLRQYTAHIRKSEGGEMTPTPVWYDSPEDRQLTVPAMRQGMTAFLITGDAARNKVQTMPGGGFSTVRIELPRNWDALMEELGYRPLSEYCISRRKK